MQSPSSSAKDRVITSFPQALFPEASPYKQFTFKATAGVQRSEQLHARSSKLVVVGDLAVGKTSLIQRFCLDTFNADYKATIGVDFEVENFTIMSMPFALNIWDTAGHERFRCIAASYYRGANVVLVVFDMENVNSLRNAVSWKEEACRNIDTDEDDRFLFLVGTKKDLVSPSVCQSMEEQAFKVAAELKAEYWTVSSKTGENVKKLLFRVAALSFDYTLREEMKLYRDKPEKIGSNVIHVRKSTREEEDAWKKLRSRLKCCH